MNVAFVAAISGVTSAVACRVAAGFLVRRAPSRFVRINVAGAPVPAVLGWAVVIGLVAGYGVWAVAELIEYRTHQCDPSELGPNELCALVLIIFPWKIFAALAVLIGGMFAVGLWDDLKGDERPRGFAGHAAALRSGVWTGGLVKLVGGAVTSLLATLLLVPDLYAIVIAACLALSANAMNLLDRAPGRTLKVFIAVALTVIVLQPGESGLFLAAPLGAALAALPLDVKGKAMLGDAGANPLGALLGAGILLGSASTEWWLWTFLVLLLGLNVASEKWSFSEIIARNRVLARLDQLGRE